MNYRVRLVLVDVVDATTPRAAKEYVLGRFGDGAYGSRAEIVKDLMTARAAQETEEQFVARMMEEAEVVEGAGLVCRICGQEASVLYSDTCVDCFRSWVLGVREKRWT